MTENKKKPVFPDFKEPYSGDGVIKARNQHPSRSDLFPEMQKAFETLNASGIVNARNRLQPKQSDADASSDDQNSQS